MEGHHSHLTPVVNMFVSLLSTVLTWITLYDAQYFLSFTLSCIGIVSGIFAMRYYYFAGNEKREKVRNIKNNNK